MMFMIAVPVAAEELTEVNQTGSISITLTDTKDDLSKENVILGLKRIANIVNGEYELIDEFKDIDVDLNQLSTAEELKEASTMFEKIIIEPDMTQKTDLNGMAMFNDVNVGVYLVYPIDIAGYEIIKPSIVSVPSWDEVTAQMNYDIQIYPKHTNLPVIRVNKVDSYTKKAIVSKDFAFTAYSDADCKKEYITVHADTIDGSASFVLSYGNWWIKETKAPTGYQLSKEVKQVEINKEGIYIDGVKKESNDNIYSFIYENQSLPSIRTGDPTIITLWVTLSLVSLLGCGFVFYKKRKSQHKQ